MAYKERLSSDGNSSKKKKGTHCVLAFQQEGSGDCNPSSIDQSCAQGVHGADLSGLQSQVQQTAYSSGSQ